MAVRIIEMTHRTIGASFVGLPAAPFNVVQDAIAPTGSSQQSAVFAGATNIVSIEADEDVHVNIGSDPTAELKHPKIKAGTSREFWVTPGMGFKVAVRTAA